MGRRQRGVGQGEHGRRAGLGLGLRARVRAAVARRRGSSSLRACRRPGGGMFLRCSNHRYRFRFPPLAFLFSASGFSSSFAALPGSLSKALDVDHPDPVPPAVAVVGDHARQDGALRCFVLIFADSHGVTKDCLEGV